MRTLILNAAADPERSLSAAAEIIRAGGLVAFPTETVYGLGALGLEPAALERIFAAKERPRADPLILHVADAADAASLVRELPVRAERLTEAFWPGPLTLVLPKSARVPDLATAGLDSVAIRMPAHPLALELIRRAGSPLAAPSANRFTRPSPTTPAHVLADLDGRIEAVLDAGPTDVGVESTVLDLRGNKPRILRPGGVAREALERVLGEPISLRVGREEAGLPSPGLLDRHYSPRARVRLFDGPRAVDAIRLMAAGEPGMGILAYTEDLVHYAEFAGPLLDLGSRGSLEEVAQTLYASIRELDDRGVRTIAVRTAPEGGLGEAINDRLTRAAGGEVTRA